MYILKKETRGWATTLRHHLLWPCFKCHLSWSHVRPHGLSLQWRDTVKFLRSPSNCRDSVRSKIDPLPLQLRSNHPPILQHYANQNPELQVPPKPSNTFSIALQTPNDLGKPRSHFCLHLSSSFCFSPLELQICSHVFVSVFTFPLSIY